MCYGHYERWKTYGDPLGGRQSPRGSTPWERVLFFGWDVTESGCWEYRGGKDVDGYGKVYPDLRAHRVSYEHFSGPIAAHSVVRHKTCDNPPCINPEHLLVGTNADNSDDAVEHRRTLRGASNPLAKLTQAEAEYIIANRGKLPARILSQGLQVSEACVYSIWNRRSWAWLPREKEEQ